MRVPRPVVVVSRFLPDPAGPAQARLLHGFLTGARSLGRDITLWSWWPGDEPAVGVPDWVRWEPLPAEPLWRTKARALLRPRTDVVLSGWQVPADSVALAEEVLSFPVVRGHARSVSTVHYANSLDARALGQWSPKRLQDVRADRRSARQAVLSTVYSARVAAALPGTSRVVPCAIELPDELLPLVDAPVAACVADWRWPPNRTALGWLLAAWPAVRAAVPAARLLLAGYGDSGVGSVPGVEVLGEVPDSLDVLGQAAVLAFPCPATSGPKVKVLEAAALGLPVVTTAAGAEGLDLDEGTVGLVDDPADAPALAAALVATLSDPERRAAMALRARSCVERSHAPEPAARTRLAVMDGAFG